MSKARHGHGSHDGIICPWQTVEGKNVGLKKGKATGARITLGESPAILISILENLDFEKFGIFFIRKGFCLNDLSFDDCMEIENETEDDSKPSITDCKIIINGSWIALVRYEQKFITYMRNLRRQRKINRDISFVYHNYDNEIIISTEIGRIVQPLFIVNKNGKLKVTLDHLEQLEREIKINDLLKKYNNTKDVSLKNNLFVTITELKELPKLVWSDLINIGIVEYLDSREKENALIATHVEDVVPGKTTHVLVHPCLNIGYSASTVVLPDHNQSPRNAYQSAHMKQFIGWPGINAIDFDLNGTSSHILAYAQKPLAASDAARDHLMVDERPTGQNPLVAICNHLGFNQEDSQIFNKSSIENGMFKTIHFSKFHAVINTSKRMVLEIPTNNNQASKREGWLDHLDSDGIPIIGARVKKGDMIIPIVRITKVTEINNETEVKKEDMSVFFKSDETGQIDKVQVGMTEENLFYIRVRIVSIRNPEVGDKFACYTPDHDILTSEGWISFDKLAKDHKVASMTDDKKINLCVSRKCCGI